MANETIGRVEVTAASQMSAAQLEDLERWFQEQFPDKTFQWARPDWYVLVHNEGGAIGRVGILVREISVGGARLRVAGINGVATRPQWRRRGVASLAMRTAAEFIGRELKCEYGLLLCRQEVSPVYAKLGWKRVPGPTSFAQPSGSAVYPNLTMVLEMGRAPFPSGPIDMLGLPW